MGEVRLAEESGVAILTIDSQETRNAITPEMADDILHHIKTVERTPSIGALVITGANQTFCSGADTRRWDVQSDPAGREAFSNSSRIYSTFLCLGNCAVPTVAAGEGAAVGAGLNLLLAADLQIVARDMRLLAGFASAGIHPGGGFFGLAARALGRNGAAAMGLYNQELSGEAAARCGLAWEATASGAALERALELATEGANDPELSRQMVRSMRMQLGPPPLPWESAIELERGVQMWSFRRASGRNS